MTYYFTGINISLCELMIISSCPWVKEEKRRLEMKFPTACPHSASVAVIL